MKKLISIVLALCLMLPCLAIADGAADGAYSAVCKGFYGDFNVTVTIAGGKIADIAWEGSMETPELGLGPRIDIINEYLERSIEEVNAAIRMLPTEETETWEELNRLFLDTVMDAAR